MTSKHCFFKLMRQDMSHKIWMLVLSVLGNVMALPVAYLLWAAATPSYYETESASSVWNSLQRTDSFLSGGVCISAGAVALIGAVIVGLAGFRYVFHRNMVDTWHSMPVKRTTLFLAGWLNGLLIWIVPFLANLAVTTVLAAGRLRKLKVVFEQYRGGTGYMELTQAVGQLSVGRLCKNALLSAVVLTVAFLLLYHFVLAVVMLCGNVLNALVMTALLGSGLTALYGFWIMFESYYFDTFLQISDTALARCRYGSPLIAPIFLLYGRAQLGGTVMDSEFPGSLAISVLLVVLLLAAAWALYLRRPSELAETGVKNKYVACVVQLVATVLAGMGGWLLFYSMAGDMSGYAEGSAALTAWGVFGAVLGAVLAAGVSDIIFHMDFKAFFCHKVRLVLETAGVLLICLCFTGDWMNYDAWMPDKTDIAELAVVSYNRQNGRRYWGSDTAERLETMHYTDTDTIYEFLQETTAFYGKDEAAQQRQKLAESANGETLEVKVTLKSGRSYARSYVVYEGYCDAAQRILTSKDYTDINYRLSDEWMEKPILVTIRRGSGSANFAVGTDITREEVEKLCRAYNQDLEEQPEVVVGGSSRCYGTLTFDTENYYDEKEIPVYAEMSHTRQALRECGMGSIADVVPAQQVEKINIMLWVSQGQVDARHLDPVEVAREMYGVGDANAEQEAEAADGQESSVRTETADSTVDFGYEVDMLCVSVTDKAEIAELLDLISFESDMVTGAIGEQPPVGEIELCLGEGRSLYAAIASGTLPEKYILRFAQ